MMLSYAIIGAKIFDGEVEHIHSALLIEKGEISSIVAQDQVPEGCEIITVDGGVLVPGFIDLQVNGGGGILFNDRRDVDGLKIICEAHIKFGTTALLPTLITDKPDITTQAIKAGISAVSDQVPGMLGIHLEGPHLSVPKRGAHKETLVREMTTDDLDELIEAKKSLPVMLTTVATESVSNDQINELNKAGIIVSLGHSNASYDETTSAAAAGATCVTHLFNGMSGFNHRDPGLAGAALNTGGLYAGLIADYIHVDPAAISIALKAKEGPGKIFLVTDAMSTIGTNMTSFTLNGRVINRSNGRLTLENGSLAGADIDMISTVKNMIKIVGFEEAIRMASLYPAEVIGRDDKMGHLKAGALANIVHLSEDHDVEHVWINGTQQWKKTS